MKRKKRNLKRNFIVIAVLVSSSLLSSSAMERFLQVQETIESELGKANLESALLVAASKGELKLVKQLVEKSHVAIEVKSQSGYTPLHLATWNQHDEVVKYLLEQGASINAQAINGKTPLHLAIESNCSKMVDNLLQAADIEMLPDVDGRLPIHYAALEGAYHFFFLARYGVEKTKLLLNAKADNGITPLHDAASKGHKDFIDFLIERGADRCVLTDDGKSVIDYAKMNGHHDVVARFLEE